MINLEAIPPLVIVGAQRVEPAELNPQQPTAVQQELKFQILEKSRTKNKELGAREDASSAENSATTQSSIDFSKLIEELQALLGKDRMVEFMIDKDSKKIVLQILDRETRDLILQLPPEQSLEIARYILGKIKEGMLADAKV